MLRDAVAHAASSGLRIARLLTDDGAAGRNALRAACGAPGIRLGAGAARALSRRADNQARKSSFVRAGQDSRVRRTQGARMFSLFRGAARRHSQLPHLAQQAGLAGATAVPVPQHGAGAGHSRKD